MGVELNQPLVGEAALEANFTNEGGVGGTTRFLKNIMGLWLVQECRRAWERAGKTYSYDDLMRQAETATPFASLVDPDDPSFILPPNMPAALADFCRRSGQPAPDGVGGTVRCALESLALCYRWVLERLETLTGRRIEVIHIVGGGSQNALAESIHRRCLRSSGIGRAGRSDGDRQRIGAGAGRRRTWLAGRCPRSGAPLL